MGNCTVRTSICGVLALLLLLVCAIFFAPIDLLSNHHLESEVSNSTTSLSIYWNEADETTNLLSTTARARLDPPTFDLNAIDRIILDWGGDNVAFTKRTSLAHVTHGGRVYITWEGNSNDAATEVALLMFDSDGSGRGVLTGALSTRQESFQLKTLTASGGILQIERTPWNMFPDSADAEFTDLVPTDAAVAASLKASNIVHRGTELLHPPTEERRQRRRLDEEDEMHTVDLLVIVTKRAVCEYNGERGDCDPDDDMAETMDRRLALSTSQTNNAFEFGNVNAQLRLVETIYLSGDFDGRPTTDTLGVLLFSDDVEEYRDDAGADLVMMVTGPHPRNCGIALLNTYVSAVGSDCFGAYTFSHEIGTISTVRPPLSASHPLVGHHSRTQLWGQS